MMDLLGRLFLNFTINPIFFTISPEEKKKTKIAEEQFHFKKPNTTLSFYQNVFYFSGHYIYNLICPF